MPLELARHAPYASPSWAAPLGADELGRDLLGRALMAGRLSLAVAVGAVLSAWGLAVSFGSLAAWRPGSLLSGIKPYLPQSCDPILRKLKDKVFRFLETNRDLLKDLCDPDWSSQAQKDFKKLESSASDPTLLRRCFDHIVGLATRIPVRGYTHQILCDHYFRQPADSRPLWYEAMVAKPSNGELYGKITATPNGSSAPPEELKDKQQKPDGEQPGQSHNDLMSSLLPLVTEHSDTPSWPELDLFATPVHSIHRWNSPTYGSFLGWLYVLRDEKGPLTANEKTCLQTLWPLLDSFAMELIEGEIQDYLGHYKGAKNPLDEIKEA